MPIRLTKIADHGVGSPFLARLTVQIFDILDNCRLPKESSDRVKDIYFDPLRKKLMRCKEITDRYWTEFRKELDTYKQQPVSLPYILRLEEECENFLYSAKSFVREVLQVFNILYGTNFDEASQYYPAKKPGKGKQSLIEFAEKTFGAADDKTQRFRELLPTVERVVNYRNAVEHPGKRAGSLKFRNFLLDPNGKFSPPTWWIEKDGNKGEESSIGPDLIAITNNLLFLAEETVVLWADDNLLFPGTMQIVSISEENRDSAQVFYRVMPSDELLTKIADISRDEERHSKN